MKTGSCREHHPSSRGQTQGSCLGGRFWRASGFYPVWEAAFLCDNMPALHGEEWCNVSASRAGGCLPVNLSLAAFPLLSLFHGQFVLPGQPCGPQQSSPYTRQTTPSPGAFGWALWEAGNEANARELLALVYKVTFLMVFVVPKLNTLKCSIMTQKIQEQCWEE